MNQRNVDGCNSGREDLAALVERGKRLHSGAIFEVFAKLPGLGKVLGQVKAATLDVDDCEDCTADRI